MKKILLCLLLFFPHLCFARLFIDFSQLSYGQVITATSNITLSNVGIVLRHPYQRITKSTGLSDVLTNYHQINLQTLQQNQALIGNKIYFVVDPFSMRQDIIFSQTNAQGFIPNFKKNREIKSFIERLLVISQYRQFGLVVDLGQFTLKERKKIEKIILKTLPDTIFFNGSSKNNITDIYHEDLTASLNTPTQVHKKAKNVINHLPFTHYNAKNTSTIFWVLSQKYPVYMDYSLLTHRYLFDLAEIAYHTKKEFRVQHINDDHLLLQSDKFLATINLGSRFGMQRTETKNLGDSISLKNLLGSSPLTIENQTISFMTWPNSVLIWQYKD